MKIINERDLTKELENVYGLKEYKSTLINYINYLNLYANEKTANFNLVIDCSDSNYYYELKQRILSFIINVMKQNNIIDGNYYSLTVKDCMRFSKFNVFPMRNTDLIIIDFNQENISNYKLEIINFLKLYQNKKFILIDNSEYFYKTIDGFNEYFNWYIKLESITEDNKLHLLNSILKEYNINVDKNCEYINEIINDNFYKVKSKGNEIIVKSKIYNFKDVTNEIVEKYLKEDKNLEKEKIFNMTIENDLNSLIGLNDLKKEVEKIVQYIRVTKKRNGKIPMLHMCFTGNPGTRKNNCC